MKFRIETWDIEKLLRIYNDGNLDLNPPYQRRFIWSLEDQQTLIESILKGYAIPNIFVYEKSKYKFEMVDGQQRTRTIIGFTLKQFETFSGENYSKKNHPHFLEYTLPVVIIEKIEKDEDIESFYALVNKAGVHLNRPELKKAEFFETEFLKLITNAASLDEFKNLDLFTESSEKRMIDLDFISELIVLQLEGNTDKKLKVDKYFKDDITPDDHKDILSDFKKVIRIINSFDDEFPIRKTRYKQRNDFYTLFGFVNENLTLKAKTHLYFYKLLVRFNKDIVPTNERCEPFQTYAFHCVSQSNSKNARDERTKILRNIFLNPNSKPNKTQKQILKYYGVTPSEKSLIEIEGIYTIDLSMIN